MNRPHCFKQIDPDPRAAGWASTHAMLQKIRILILGLYFPCSYDRGLLEGLTIGFTSLTLAPPEPR